MMPLHYVRLIWMLAHTQRTLRILQHSSQPLQALRPISASARPPQPAARQLLHHHRCCQTVKAVRHRCARRESNPGHKHGRLV